MDIRLELHWLPVYYRISYKLSLFTWKALHTAEPSYFSELISPCAPTRTLRSVNTGLLVLPTGITSHFASRSFSVSSPSVWNSLPAHVRSIDNLSTFKRHFKWHVFQSAFTALSPCASTFDSFLTTLALYKFSCTYVCKIYFPLYSQLLILHLVWSWSWLTTHSYTRTSHNDWNHTLYISLSCGILSWTSCQ